MDNSHHLGLWKALNPRRPHHSSRGSICFHLPRPKAKDKVPLDGGFCNCCSLSPFPSS